MAPHIPSRSSILRSGVTRAIALIEHKISVRSDCNAIPPFWLDQQILSALQLHM